MKANSILPIVLAFGAGFGVHMFFFTDFVPSSIMPAKPSSLKASVSGAPQPTSEFAKSVVYVEYKDGRFNPTRVVSKVGNRIIVRNADSEEKMWLESDGGVIKTVRPYGLSEQVDVVPRIAGTITVKNKVNEGASFTVVIKP